MRLTKYEFKNYNSNQMNQNPIKTVTKKKIKADNTQKQNQKCEKTKQ
jgi:hypothetical protein